MYNKKNLITIFSFIGLSLWASLVAFSVDKESLNNIKNKYSDHIEQAEFRGVHFFNTLANKPKYELNSDRLILTGDSLMEFLRPSGNIFKDDQKMNYKAGVGYINQNLNFLELAGDVEIRDERSLHQSKTMIFKGRKNHLLARGGVYSEMLDLKSGDTLKLKSKTLFSDLDNKIAKFEGDVKGLLVRKRAYEGSMQLEAQEMEFNSLKSLVKLYEDVKIHRNNYYLTAGNAEIFLENFNKKLKYYVLYDEVVLREKMELPSGKSVTRTATAAQLEAHRSTGKIILSGAPSVSQGNDIIKGYQITLRENVEMVEVDDSQSNFSLKKDKK